MSGAERTQSHHQFRGVRTGAVDGRAADDDEAFEVG